MSYLDYINEFWNRDYAYPFSTGQIALFFALLNCANKSRWSEWFPVNFRVLATMISMTPAGASKAKDALVRRGIIDYSEEDKHGMFKITLSTK